MEVIRGQMKTVKPPGEAFALTIGNFDGIHLGHQSLLKQLIQLAKAKNLPSAVLTFDPHPEEYFKPDSLKLISTLDSKLQELEKAGIDCVFIQDFGRDVAECSCHEFLSQWIHPWFKPSLFVLGYDFSFGKGSQGGIVDVEKFYQSTAVEIVQAPRLKLGDKTVSSSLVRTTIEEGLMPLVSSYLGRPYSIQGRVVKGDQIGRNLGFPTANLSGIETILPSYGVYSGRVEWKAKTYEALINIGKRPTLTKGLEERVEVHLLNFNENLYDKSLTFQFHEKLREEKKFLDKDELKQQIKTDIDKLKESLKD